MLAIVIALSEVFKPKKERKKSDLKNMHIVLCLEKIKRAHSLDK